LFYALFIINYDLIHYELMRAVILQIFINTTEHKSKIITFDGVYVVFGKRKMIYGYGRVFLIRIF